MNKRTLIRAANTAAQHITYNAKEGDAATVAAHELLAAIVAANNALLAANKAAKAAPALADYHAKVGLQACNQISSLFYRWCSIWSKATPRVALD